MALNHPDLPSDALHPFHREWARTRTVVAGSQAVKARGTEFLPMVHGQGQDDYLAYKMGVTFLPMAASVLESYLGLMFRKAPVLEPPGILEAVEEAVTRDGMSIEELSKWVSREVFQTNWCGLLIDQSAAKKNISLAEQMASGDRPYIAPYTAENILDIQFGVVRGRRKPVYVRLKDNDDQVRHLSLSPEGNYQVQLEVRADNAWRKLPVQVPTLRNKPLSEIPFVMVTLDRCTLPQKAPLADVVELNCNHYCAMGRYEMALLYSATPIKVLTGFKPEMREVIETVKDADGNDTDVKRMVPVTPTFDTSPNAIWTFKDDVKAENLEYSGTGISDMRQRLVDMEDKVSELSGGFWSREKASVESAETHRLRLSTQNAKVANMANSISGKVAEALSWLALWIGIEQELSFSFNTDYMPMPMSSTDLTAQLAANANGKMADESLFLSMRDRGIFDKALTWEEEQKRRAFDQSKAVTLVGTEPSVADDQPDAPAA